MSYLILFLVISVIVLFISMLSQFGEIKVLQVRVARLEHRSEVNTHKVSRLDAFRDRICDYFDISCKTNRFHELEIEKNERCPKCKVVTK